MIDLVIDFAKPESKSKLWSCLKNLQGEQVIKIKRRSKGRSVPENRYYWGAVIGTISNYTGHSPWYLHEYYKHKFIPLVRFTDDTRLTTTDMTHQEIWDYIDLIREEVQTVLELSIADPDGVIL